MAAPASSVGGYRPEYRFPEEEKKNGASNASASATAVAAPSQLSTQQPPLPKTLTLQQLADFSLGALKQKYGGQFRFVTATTEEIRDAAERKDFFGLRNLLEQTVTAEWMARDFSNVDRRNEFFQAFAFLKNLWKPSLSDIKQGKGEFANLSEAQRKELEFFVTESRGAESVQVFAKVPLCLNPLDKDYPSRIMTFANNNWQFRANDPVPGLCRPLRDYAYEKKEKDPKKEEKTNIPLSEELLFSERVGLKKEVFTDALTSMHALSDRLESSFKEYGPHGRIFLRGMMGAGKTHFLENVLRIPEGETSCADAIKKTLGGDLAHHEAVSINDRLADPKVTERIPYVISIKTNVRKEDNEGRNSASGLCVPRDHRTHIICDLAISYDEAKQRMLARAERGGRIANDMELQESYNNSVENRPAVIKAALESEKIVWKLYSHGELIAWIQGKQAFVSRSQMGELERLRSVDQHLDGALKEVSFRVV